MSSINGQRQQSVMWRFWEKHPFLYEVAQVINEGNWINHLFEWLFMIVSRLAAYGMTIAIGFLIYYAIETHNSLSLIPTGVHATWVDGVASFSSTIINVTPELVFPGVVVLCVKAFIARKKLDGWLYGLTAFGFGLLTMILLHAFMSGDLNDGFMAVMLFWRAFAAIFYTVAVAICGSHGSLDLRTILKELDEAREEIAAREEREATLRKQFDAVNQRVATLTRQLDSANQQVTLLTEEIKNKQILVSSGQGQAHELEGKVHGLTLQLQQVTHERDQLKLFTNRSENSGRDLQLRLEKLDQQVLQLEEVNRSLTSQLQEVTFEKQTLTSQFNRSQQEVSDLEKQVTSLTSKVTSSATTGQVKTPKRSVKEEVTQKAGQGTVLQFDESRRKDPLAVKAWCDAHPDLTQIQMAEQLKISDVANLRRILRRAREMEEGGEQVANER